MAWNSEPAFVNAYSVKKWDTTEFEYLSEDSLQLIDCVNEDLQNAENSTYDFRRNKENDGLDNANELDSHNNLLIESAIDNENSNLMKRLGSRYRRRRRGYQLMKLFCVKCNEIFDRSNTIDVRSEPKKCIKCETELTFCCWKCDKRYNSRQGVQIHAKMMCSK